MRYLRKKENKPEEPSPWEYRTITRFLWFPKSMKSHDLAFSSDTRWLERSPIRQRYWWDYELGGDWVDVGWGEKI